MNDRLACVSGVKEHVQSHRAETNRGLVVRHGCCRDTVIPGSSVVPSIPVVNGRITGFTCAVWMRLAVLCLGIRVEVLVNRPAPLWGDNFSIPLCGRWKEQSFSASLR